MNSVRSLRAQFARASLVVCFSVSILFAKEAFAQQSGPPVKLPKLMSTAQKSFEIPFTVNASSNMAVQVVLQMSVDRGKTWQPHSQRAANAKGFPFSTSNDGEYWFAIQSIDRDGTKTPADHLLRPELRIAVDTVKPSFDFNVRPDAAGRVVGSWTAMDTNIDTCSMKIEYQSPGGQWISVPTNSCRKAKHAVFRDELAWWPDTTSTSLTVRASVKDLAGNEVSVTRSMNLPTVANRRGQGGTVAKKPPLMTNYQRSRLPVALAHLYGDTADPKAGSGNPQAARVPQQARQLPIRQNQRQPATGPPTNSTKQNSDQPAGSDTSPRTSEMKPPQPPRSRNRFASNSVTGQSPLNPQARAPSREKQQQPGSDQTWNSQTGSANHTAQIQSSSTYQYYPSVGNGSSSSSSPSQADAVTNPLPTQVTPSNPSAKTTLPPPSRSPVQWQSRSQPRVAQSSASQPPNQTIAVGTTSRFPRQNQQMTEVQERVPQGEASTAPFRSIPPPVNQTVTRSMPASSADNPLGGSAQNAQWSSSTTGALTGGAMEPAPQPSSVLASGPMMESLRKRARPSSARQFQMEYDINAVGPDGVKEVQLWMTRDGGNSWRKHSVDPDQRSPITAAVDSDGIFGFRILVVSNDGLRARVPKRGDPADVWVNVDTDLPTVKITGIPYGRGDDAGKLLVQWQANDANLSLRPVRLQYSTNPQGPWTTVEDGIRNVGQYAWKPAVDIPDLVYLRLQVRDIAGNVKTETIGRPIDISGLIPRGRIRGITPLNQNGSITNVETDNST